MKNNVFTRLESNLRRDKNIHSVLGQKYYEGRLTGLDYGNYKTWLEQKLLPNTRLIIEPKIQGTAIVLTYEKGYLKKAINKRGLDKTFDVSQIKNVPTKIPVVPTIRIRGQIYYHFTSTGNAKTLALKESNLLLPKDKEISFASFQILNVDLNQYSQLQELYKLGFQIPPNEYTRFSTSEVEIFVDLWKDKKIFSEIPNNGIVLKVNSRKFQKELGENISYPYWAYAIKR